MQVTSKKSISFPKLGWAISAGETKELPEGKEAQARILSEPDIVEVEKTINNKKSSKEE